MKHIISKFSLVAVACTALSINTSCTPTEAAIVGGLAGAAIGAAVADDRRQRPPRGPRCGPGGVPYGGPGGFAPRGGYVPRGGGGGFGGPGWY